MENDAAAGLIGPSDRVTDAPLPPNTSGPPPVGGLQPVVVMANRGGGDATVRAADEPKFMGMCLPAATCCCGCTLRCGLYTFGLLGIIVGVLNLLGVMVAIGTHVNVLYFYTLAVAICQLVFGVMCWKAAADLHPQVAWRSTVPIVLLLLLSICRSIGGIVIASNPEYETKLEEKYVEEIRRHNANGTISNDEKEAAHTVAHLAARAELTGSALSLIIMPLATIGIVFVLWSFSRRILNSDHFLVCQGVAAIPRAPTPYVVNYVSYAQPGGVRQTVGSATVQGAFDHYQLQQPSPPFQTNPLPGQELAAMQQPLYNGQGGGQQRQE